MNNIKIVLERNAVQRSACMQLAAIMMFLERYAGFAPNDLCFDLLQTRQRLRHYRVSDIKPCGHTPDEDRVILISLLDAEGIKSDLILLICGKKHECVFFGRVATFFSLTLMDR